MSLVQGQPFRQHAGLVGRFAAAFTVTSFTVFSVAGGVGLATAKALPAPARLVAVCVVLLAALALDTYSLRRRTWCPITLRRQTPKHILNRLGPARAAVAWGLDTGLVFTTYRMSAIPWALLALGLLGAVPWWVGIGYAAGFLVPLTAGLWIWRIPKESPDAPVLPGILSRRTWVGRLACVIVLVLAAATAVAELAR